MLEIEIDIVNISKERGSIDKTNAHKWYIADTNTACIYLYNIYI